MAQIIYTGVNEMDWRPPGKNCGLCGAKTCNEFSTMVDEGQKVILDCPFCQESAGISGFEPTAKYTATDILGFEYDFIISPLPGEISARKIVLPFRSDLVEKWNIRAGDIVVGRPMGQGCPVQHVLKVIKANPVTGVIDTWVVGPKFSREGNYKDVEAYHVIAFEGMARTVKREPMFGMRQTFLPGFCMMSLGHTGVINMVLVKKEGVHIRVEDIRILARPREA